MAILEKEVWVGLGGGKFKYYESVGYSVPKYKDTNGKLKMKQGTKILVQIKDLPYMSNVMVTKICDDCGKNIPNRKYSDILISRIEGDGKDRCKKCSAIKGGISQKRNVKYENSLESFAKENNINYLLEEFSDKNNQKPSQLSFGTKTIVLWNCPNCKSEYPMEVEKRTGRNFNCPYCSGRRINKTNCLWNTHPEIAKLLVDSQRGYEVTHGMNKKEKFKCKECGNEDIKSISDVVSKGFSCSKCSDGLSYPEKFMINLMDQINIKYKKEVIFEWSKKIKHKNKKISGDKRYDFYLPDLNMIIETHGMQHYDGGFHSYGGKTSKEEHENDRLKEKIAKQNGIKHYIVIDCRKSELEYIKRSIKQSELSGMFDLSYLNWMKCHEFACSTLVKEISNLWNKGFKTIEIAKKINFSRTSIIKHLKKGTELGWCNYDAKEEIKKNSSNNGKKSAIKIAQLTSEGIFLKEWHGAREAGRNLRINSASISNNCRGKSKSAGGYKWMYKEDYDQYIAQAK